MKSSVLVAWSNSHWSLASLLADAIVFQQFDPRFFFIIYFPYFCNMRPFVPFKLLLPKINKLKSCVAKKAFYQLMVIWEVQLRNMCSLNCLDTGIAWKYWWPSLISTNLNAFSLRGGLENIMSKVSLFVIEYRQISQKLLQKIDPFPF